LSAASALEPSGPPACAISARPPPPLPPSASAPLRTRSIAEKRDVRSAVTPTTTPALPSSVTPTMATPPEPRRVLPSSTRLRRPQKLHIADHAHAIRALRAPSAHGELLLRLRKLAFEAAALVEHLRQALRHVLKRRLELRRRCLGEFAQVTRVLARRGAGERL